MFERKFIATQCFTKAIDGRTVTGLLAVTGNIDSGYDRIMPGAFVKTIAENARRVKHLWMHDSDDPPTARIVELREVGANELPDELKILHPDAQGGLLVKREYLNTPRGSEILEGIKAGAITEGSIGFDTIKSDDSMEEIGRVRNIREVRLWDTSDVNWGMNGATMNIKRLTMPDILGLADELKAGRMLSAANLQLLKEALAKITEIISAAEPPTEDATQRASALTVVENEILKRRQLLGI